MPSAANTKRTPSVDERIARMRMAGEQIVKSLDKPPAIALMEFNILIEKLHKYRDVIYGY